MNAKRTLLTTLLVATSLSLGANAFGQTAPSWDRKVVAVALTPDPTGPLWNLSAVIEIEAVHAGAALDLGTDVFFHLNGMLIGTAHVDAPIPIGPANMCPAGFECFTSLPSGECVCIAVTRKTIPIDPAMLQPSDEIMVLLRPAPGADPEPSSAHDHLVVSNIGASGDYAHYWDFGLTSVELRPVPAGATFDVFFEVDVEIGYDLKEIDYLVDLSAELEVWINSALFTSIPIDGHVDTIAAPSPCLTGICGAVCATIGGAQASCATDSTFPGAACQVCRTTLSLTIPGVPVDPGDELRLVLRPAPGALPELPGFEGDDEQEPEVQLLYADVDELSLLTGGTQNFSLTAGPAFANEFYILAASTSGSVPGFQFGPVHVPLNPDPWFFQTLFNLNLPPYFNNFALLNAGGNGSASFNMPPGLDPGLAGLVMTHAYVVYEFGNGPLTVSNAVTLTLVP